MAIGSRYIDGEKLIEKIEDGAVAAVERWLKRQPKTPKLVSRQGAAAILGVSSPHISRLDARMPPGIEIRGSSRPIYDLEAVEALAAELRAERGAKT